MARKLALAVILAVALAACSATGAGSPAKDTNQAAAPALRAGVPKRLPSASEIDAILARQPELMARALAALQAERPGVPEYFFVGLAGWASEDVFLNEVRSAAGLFQRRFGTLGHSLVLANNPNSVAELPLASVANLKAALAGVGERMGREDVLFLYLSSHGRPGKVNLRFGKAGLRDLYAEELRRMLDEAGIQNRVLAISACYSGSFIETLGNENTLIMTAAAADRVSFGCGHDGPFTYFGRALIGEAMQTEFSFHPAFDVAAKAIARRERAEGFTPSRPQFYAGAAIGPVVQGLARRLRDESRGGGG